MSKLRSLSSLPYRESLQILAISSIVLLTYSLARLVFYLINAGSFPVPVSEILLALKTGLRFDLATLAYGAALGLPALALGAGISRRRFMRLFALWAFFAPQAVALFMNMADIAYFRHVSRRQTNEIFTMPSEVLNASFSEALQYWWLVILTLVMTVLLFLALRGALRLIASRLPRPSAASEAFSSWSLWSGRALLTLGVIGGGIFLARGGTQDRPLRTGMAFTSDNPTLGQLALNSAYSIIWTRLHQNGRTLHFMDSDTALTITQRLIDNQQKDFLDKRFPFLRLANGLAPPDDTIPLNVVIFIMESWNAQQTGAIMRTKKGADPTFTGVTPVFDSLARDGLLFTNFYASGDRSIHAFPAVVASLPNLTGSGILHTSLETKRARGLGSILKERGYTTIFAMGTEPSSMGFDSYAKASGFDIHFSEDSYPDSLREKDSNQWGIFDERFMGFVEERLAQTHEPFALTFFSLTAHSPYVVPESFAQKYPIKDDTNIDGAATHDVAAQRQRRALRYADYALGQFFNAAKQRDYFKRTIFIVTGDHTGWEEQTDSYTSLERFQVPLLIYAPAMDALGIISPRTDSLPANQVDILPTVLSLLGGQSLSAAMGQSLVAPHNHRVSFSAKASVVHFLYDSLFIQATTDTILGVYNYWTDPELVANLLGDSATNPQVSEAVTTFRAYLQTGTNSLIDDRIFPSAPLLQEILQNTGN